jgi:type I restriction enzyme M protein
VLDKEHAAARTGIFMIDASKGFVKDGNKNRLRHQDIHKIVDIFTKQIAVDKYFRLVSRAEIEANDFNVNIPRYIDATEAEDLQDIDAHLKGGIPDRDVAGLSPYWQVCPGLKAQLFSAADRPGYSTHAYQNDQTSPQDPVSACALGNILNNKNPNPLARNAILLLTLTDISGVRFRLRVSPPAPPWPTAGSR